MSRLYYDQKATSLGFSEARENNTAAYFEKVAKLIPSEIIAGYMTLIGFVPLIKIKELQPWFYWGIVIFCLLLTPWYLSTMSDKGKPKMMHLIISTMAFVIWVYVISGAILVPSFYDSAIASIVLICFSLISGKIPLA